MLRAILGDITTLHVDAVVNAANATLLGGGGVDGAIHKAAGPSLLHECFALQGCGEGDAKITQGYNLPAGQVIHAVGPVWHGGESGEAEVLAACYRRCIELASAHSIKSLAFPCIAVGRSCCPVEQSAQIAVSTVRKALLDFPGIEEVIFCCFSEDHLHAYEKVLQTQERNERQPLKSRFFPEVGKVQHWWSDFKGRGA